MLAEVNYKTVVGGLYRTDPNRKDHKVNTLMAENLVSVFGACYWNNFGMPK